ncbi:MAG: hypothetical protein WA719_04805, partial [Thermoplasmata archaeon]
SSTSTQFETGIIYTADNHNLVVTQQFWETGTVLFDALSRQWNITAEDDYQGYAPPVNEPASYANSLPDTMVPGNSNLYLLYLWGGEFQKGVPVYSNSPETGYLIDSSTTSSSQVQGFDVSVGVDLDGVDIGTTIAADHWSQTSSSTTTKTLTWTVYGKSATVPVCYAVYGEGGASTSTKTTADTLSVWAYTPTNSAGSYTCPLPT